MEKHLRTAIGSTAQELRNALEKEFVEQLEGIFDVHRSGNVASSPGSHLSRSQQLIRSKLVSAIEYLHTSDLNPAEAVARFVRDSAFTTLNRFVALKMLEARQLVQQCVSRGSDSSGYREFVGLAAGVDALPHDGGYRLYLESLFDELATEVKVLFDRRDTASLLWPRHKALEEMLAELNRPELDAVWADDETVGWFYQFFNSKEERQQMRDESQAPRNSREVAVRNQFFTPRYVVQFLVDNTLGRAWIEMFPETELVVMCGFFAAIQERPQTRALKDPRDFRILDPACGSGHFLLYAFDLLVEIYHEAWDASLVDTNRAGPSLRQEYLTREELDRHLPKLIVEQNLHGVDIDPRAAQIAALALWMRAQKAWGDVGIAPSDRPAIRKTGIVIAEPMPGDDTMVEEFAVRLDPPLLGELFRNIVEELRLAGEIGVLVQVERAVEAQLRRARHQFNQAEDRDRTLPGFEPARAVGDLDLFGIDDDRFFQEAEVRIIDALREFAEVSSRRHGTRRRLFADDAVQGMALIDIVRSRFDVILMNPPFGLMPRESYEYLVSAYPAAYYDLAVTFVARAMQLLAAGGLCGAITTRAFMLVSDAERFRKEIALPMIELLADLGSGVMDGAAVDASAEVLSHHPEGSFAVIDLRRHSDKAFSLAGATADVGTIQRLDRSAFRALPAYRIAYDAVAPLSHMFSSDSDGIEPAVAIARIGASTFDDERFLRARWEIAREGIGPRWMPSSRTAEEFSLYYYPPLITVKWADNGSEVCARNEQVNGQSAQARQGSSHYGKPGLVFARRSSPSIAFRAHPAGCSFASNTGVVIPTSAADIPLLEAFLNSSPARAAINALSNRDSYTVGHIKKLRWPSIDADSKTSLMEAGGRILKNRHRLFRLEETDPWFTLEDGFCSAPSSRAAYEQWSSWTSSVVDDLITDYGTIDDIVTKLCRIDGISSVREAFGVDVVDVLQPKRLLDVTWKQWLARAISLAMGVALGRWSAPHTAQNFPDMEEQIAPHGGIPLPPQHGHDPNVGSVPWLVDDPGHPQDVAARVEAAWAELWPADEGHIDVEMTQVFGQGLREWIAADFFAVHRHMYSTGKRVAPIYWQLASPSGQFSVWLYLHDLTSDTLFKLQTDYVAPRLSYEERTLADLDAQLNSQPLASTKAEAARQQILVDELRHFAAELKRLAPIWSPFLDDGVLLNFAPLWRLVPQATPWQRDLRKAWEGLRDGTYDWAQLAMHLWPERVVRKCAEDRSLAIAHGLEDVFWVRDSENDDKWRRRSEPTIAIAQLLAQRHNPATAAALQQLST